MQNYIKVNIRTKLGVFSSNIWEKRQRCESAQAKFDLKLVGGVAYTMLCFFLLSCLLQVVSTCRSLHGRIQEVGFYPGKHTVTATFCSPWGGLLTKVVWEGMAAVKAAMGKM